ncbi:MAG: bifunctional oligoribonuclease/PAP phosphatase NrnA [Clostridiales bacterium]|nr:bifunctional oligoribonuclease/PAP phosphatase NrnA [Clostridiales bacterium]
MDNILEIIKPYNEIIIAGHIKPDGDAVGACLALAMICNKIGKQPKIILDKFTDRYNIIPGEENIFTGDCNEIKPDVFISLDCGDVRRLNEKAADLFNRSKVTINIDHHISNTNFAQYNYVETLSSTCELVYKLFIQFIIFDKDIASAIYAGVIYDTGGLRYKNTTPETVSIVANLMSLGIDHSELYSSIMTRYSYNEIMSVAKGVQNLIIDGDVAFSFFTIGEMKELNVDVTDLDYIITYMMNIDNICTGVFIYETEENIFKVSLRSKVINVSELAKSFGGGGHVNAAGCTLSGSKNEVYAIIKTKIQEEIENVKRRN